MPVEIEPFYMVVRNVRSLGGYMHFDDIQLTPGNETSFTGVNALKRNPPGKVKSSTLVVEKNYTLLISNH